MKRIILLSSLLMFFAAGCSKEATVEEAAIEMLSGVKSQIELDSDGDVENIRFSSTKAWHIEMSDDAAWLEVSPLEGEAGTGRIKVSADINKTGETRTAEVNVCSEEVKVTLTFVQDKYVPTFELLDTEKEISCLGGEFAIKVYTDVDYEYHCEADWVHLPNTKAPRVREVLVSVDPNTSEERTAVITFCSDNTCKSFTITQRPVGTEADDWKKDAFVHRSLAMRFTATWCGYCPMMGTAFDSAKSQMTGSLELLSLHGQGSDLEFSGTNAMVSRFKVSGYPTGVVDARASVANNDSAVTASRVVDVAKETQEAYPATSGIACSSTLDGSELTMDIDVYFKEADSYRVTVLLLEDKIVGYQNGASRDYVHNDVARLALTSMSGESVKLSEGGQVWTKSYTANINSGWNPENLKILVYVEKTYGDGGKVAQVNGVQYGNYGDTYIDNCRAVPVGVSAELELR